jgi:membrane protease subunit HflK
VGPSSHEHGHHHPHSQGGALQGLRHRLIHLRARAGWRQAGIVLAAIYLLSGTFFVQADQQAVVLVFERVSRSRILPGLHWTWPYPISRVEKLRTWEMKRLTVGMEDPDRILGRSVGDARSQFLTGDQNVINVRLAVQYNIKDPVAYLFSSVDVQSVLARTVESSLSAVVVRRRVDDLLTTEKVAVQQEVQSHSQGLLDTYGCGISLSSISIESIRPPDEALEAFRDVASAREDRERIKREADIYANEVVPRARGEAARWIAEANGYCERKISEAQGDAAKFESLTREYQKAREVTSARLFLETMEEVLPRLKKVVVESGSGGIDIDLIQKKQ